MIKEKLQLRKPNLGWVCSLVPAPQLWDIAPKELKSPETAVLQKSVHPPILKLLPQFPV